jgi:hypothetical protein
MANHSTWLYKIYEKHTTAKDITRSWLKRFDSVFFKQSKTKTLRQSSLLAHYDNIIDDLREEIMDLKAENYELRQLIIKPKYKTKD